MKVSLIAMTKELTTDKVRKPEDLIVKIARVSSGKTGEELYKDPAKLIKYCLDHKHFSIFEQVNLTYEIETSLAIATQLLRHRSICFQMFSARYQDVTKVSDEMFEPIELRKKGPTNRQSSGEEFIPQITVEDETDEHFLCDISGSADEIIDMYLNFGKKLYESLLAEGVAAETARFILPQCTRTKLYLNANVRSLIHLLQARDDEHAQKEIQLVAKEIKRIFIEHFPHTAEALEWI